MRQRRSWWRAAPIALAIAVLISVATPAPASAITLFSFTGRVTDNLGRPIASATVTDGLQDTPTASDGTYKLDEGATGQYTLRSYKSSLGGTTSQTVTVTIPLPTTVDFTPESGHPFYYRVTSNVSPSTVSTVSSAKVLSLAIQTTAPNPGSICVRVRDSRTGQVDGATYVSTVGTQSNWSHQINLPQGTAQGSYTLTSWAVDCPGGNPGTFLSNPSANAVSSYTIDNTPPKTDPKSVIPMDQGNTAFVVQPLSAVITDTGGAGISQSSIRFDLTDTSVSPPSTRTFTNVPYNSGTRRATVLNPGALEVGHSYSLTINASDTAGNAAASVTTTFAVLKLELPLDSSNPPQPINPTAEIPPTTSSSTNFDVGTGTTFTFDVVPLALGNFTLNIIGTPAHAGYGYIREDVDLTKASITLYKTVTINGESHDEEIATIPAPATWGTVPAFTQWRLTTPPGTANPSVFVSASQPAIKQLTVSTLVPGADKAVVSMQSRASVTPDAAACANPTTSCGALKYATPDPMPFYFSAQEAAVMAANELTRDQDLYNLAAETTTPTVEVTNPVPPCQAEVPLSSQYNCIATYVSTRGVTKFTFQALLNVTETDDNGNPTWDLAGGAPEYYQLLYQGALAGGVVRTAPLIPPVSYPGTCSVTPCTQSVANANTEASGPAPDPYDAHQKCIKEDSSIDDDGHNCYQYVTLEAGEYQGLYVNGQGQLVWNDPAAHLHYGEMNNTKGWHNADEDHLSIGLQTDGDVGWTNKITTGHGYYRKHPLDPNNPDNRQPCAKPVLSYEYGTSYSQERPPNSPDPDVQLVYTNVANKLRLKQGPAYYSPCEGAWASPDPNMMYKNAQLGRAWMGWTTVNPQGNQGRGGTAFVQYGHDKSGWGGRGWSCSAGASGTKASAGCSYGWEYQTKTDWWMETHAQYLY